MEKQTLEALYLGFDLNDERKFRKLWSDIVPVSRYGWDCL